MTKSDVLIICGDGGFVWSDVKRDKWWIEWISNKPWTTVYIDGNHENHPLLNSYPVVDFYGAKAIIRLLILFIILKEEKL